MGTKRVPYRSNGKQIDDSWFNVIRSAISNDIVSRDATTGDATDAAGSLGAASYHFLRAFIGQGGWDCGDFKLHHSFNGSVGPGEGWMLCDGRTVSQAHYDTEHGSGHWATYVGSSPINGKNLPDFTGDKLAYGVAATTQDGSSPISTVGADGFDIGHVHEWYQYTSDGIAGVNDLNKSYNSAGTLTAIAKSSGAKDASHKGWCIGTDATASQWGTSISMYTDQLTARTSTLPNCNEFQVYMRII